MNSKSLLAKELRAKDYRHAFVRSQVRIGLPLQCRALRESREWTQPQLAAMAGMSQPRISEIERPGERKLNLETLFRLAEAYDVALLVKFVPFTEFVDTTDGLRLDGLSIKPFDEDLKDLENNEIWAKGKKTLDAMLQKPEVARRSEKEPKDNPLNPIKRKVIEMPKDLNSALSGNDSQEGKEEKFYEACGG